MPNFDIEREYPGKIIIGVDEAGRGPLAGPVVAAAVIVDQANIRYDIDDSKKLSVSKRNELFNFITANYKYHYAIIEADEIDKINILQATIKACIEAVRGLNINNDKIILVDGNMKFHDHDFKSIIKGDSKSISIAAASIIAKVVRDKIMRDLSLIYEKYGWNKNSGYGTKAHIEAIKQFGATSYHRKTFKVKGLNEILD